MTPVKLAKLERLAVTAGGRRGKNETPWVTTDEPDDRDCYGVLTEPDGAEFAECVPSFIAPFIAAANPTVVLELIDAIRKLRAAR